MKNETAPVFQNTNANKNQQILWILGGFILLSMIVFTTYSNAFKAVWIYDDFDFIVKNENIRMEKFTWEEIEKSFHGYRTNNTYYRPLTFLTFALNHYFHGYEIFGYHLVNIIIHIINSCLLLALMIKTLSLVYPEKSSVWVNRISAFIAASLWATSPLHIMAVTDVWQRTASLTALFYFTAFLFYIKGREAFLSNPSATFTHPGTRVLLYAAGSFSAFVLGLLSKENTAILPAAIIVYDIIIFQGGGWPALKRTLKFIVPVGIVIMAIGFIYRNPSSFLDYTKRTFTLWERLLTEGRILIFYISQIFFPAPSRLNLLHHVPVSTSIMSPVTTVLSIAGIIILLVLAFTCSKKYKLFSLAVFFYFLNHVVESTIIPIELIYEHRNYIPSLFIYLLVSAGIARVVFRADNQLIKSAVCILAGLCIFNQYHITHTRNMLFHDSHHLWQDVTLKSPGLSTAWINFGISFDNLSDADKKMASYLKALEVDTFNNANQKVALYINLGNVYLVHLADYDKAAYYYQKALSHKKSDKRAWLNLIKTRFIQKKYQMAGQTINHALKYAGNHGEFFIFKALKKVKQNAEPESVLEAVNIAREKGGEGQGLLLIEAEALRRSGKYSSAIRIHEQLLEELPASPAQLPSVLSLVELYKVTGQAEKLEKMIQYYRTVSQGKDMLTLYSLVEGGKAYELPDEVVQILQDTN